MLRMGVLLAAVLLSHAALAAEAEPSVEHGERIARIGGCHDCHSPGYAENGGQLDPATALIGSPVGYQGPWGTTYAANLRLTAAEHSEDEWVAYLSELETRPPMPWFNLRHFTETEMRSLYQYIVALGPVGEPAPAYAPPGTPATTPFIVMAPPSMPE
ncbi:MULTISPECIES: cytochrome C [unclassified Devosia]|uniref:cytochrome C n=1 Tax=unclassified Devosia TaxID=196773 RepID=UPI000FD99A30|nr:MULTISPECIES: cytochrome C [unclassified Devosia]